MSNILSASTLVRQLILSVPSVAEAIKVPDTDPVVYKCFPLRAPQDTVGSFIVYARTGYSSEDTAMGTAREKSIITANLVTDDYDEGQKLADDINDALRNDQKRDILRIRMTDATEDTTGWPDGASTKFVQILTFEISKR